MTEKNFDDLLDNWQAAYETGRDIPAAELCRDCPELITEVRRRIEILRLGARLVGSAVADMTASLHGDTAPIPQRLGAYRLLGRIGGGGMGEVFRAEDPALGRQVAVKVMRPELAARPGTATGSCARPGPPPGSATTTSCPSTTSARTAAPPFIVMPLLEGESLEDRLERDGRLPPGEAVAGRPGGGRGAGGGPRQGAGPPRRQAGQPVAGGPRRPGEGARLRAGPGGRRRRRG